MAASMHVYSGCLWSPWRSAVKGLNTRPCPLRMLLEVKRCTVLRECKAKIDILEQKLHKVNGELLEVDIIKCDPDFYVTALSSNLGQAEATIRMLCNQMEELATERQAARVKRRALEKANRDPTTQCDEARTENRALHH